MPALTSKGYAAQLPGQMLANGGKPMHRMVAAGTNFGIGALMQALPIARALLALCEPLYRTRVPGAAGSAFNNIAPPPSGLAASTMPFDSMPINFAGFRLATITIVLPTSASG
jgi:hypothetical protein